MPFGKKPAASPANGNAFDWSAMSGIMATWDEMDAAEVQRLTAAGVGQVRGRYGDDGNGNRRGAAVCFLPGP